MALTELEDGSQAIRVVEVIPGGPAEKAGLAPKDLVVAIDGQPIDFANDLERIRWLDRFKAGQAIELRLLRGDAMLSKSLVGAKTSPENLARLQSWLESLEQQIATAGSRPILACVESTEDKKRNYLDDSSRRWAELLQCGELENGGIEFTVGRPRAGDPLELHFSDTALDALGFGLPDLPENLRRPLESLREGDAVRFRINISGNGILIDSLTPYPEYITQPGAAP